MHGAAHRVHYFVGKATLARRYVDSMICSKLMASIRAAAELARQPVPSLVAGYVNALAFGLRETR